MPLVPFTAGQNITAAALNAAFDITRVAYQSVDQTMNNSTTYVSSTGLTLTIEASSNYLYESLIMFDTNSTADFKQKLLLPAGATVRIARWSSPTTGTAIDSVVEHDAITVVEIASGGVAAGTVMSTRASGLIQNSTAAGSVTVQFAQNAANVSNTLLKTGSWIRLTKVS